MAFLKKISYRYYPPRGKSLSDLISKIETKMALHNLSEIIKNSNKIITYDQALKKINNNSFYKSIKNLSAIILKFKRIIKS